MTKDNALVSTSDLKRLADGDKAALITVRQNPGSALALLSEMRQQDEMNVGAQSRVMELVVGEISNRNEARSLLLDNMTDDHVRELHAHRGDLPSVMDDVASADDLVETLLLDLNQYMSGDSTLNSFYIRGWALKLRDRDDWDELLEKEIFGFTLRDHLIIACYWDSFATGVYDEQYEADVTDDMFVGLGVDPEEGRERLRELLDEDVVPEINLADLAAFQQSIVDRHRELHDEAHKTISDDADELDI